MSPETTETAAGDGFGGRGPRPFAQRFMATAMISPSTTGTPINARSTAPERRGAGLEFGGAVIPPRRLRHPTARSHGLVRLDERQIGAMRR